jgi:hypothetical protein
LIEGQDFFASLEKLLVGNFLLFGKSVTEQFSGWNVSEEN